MTEQKIPGKVASAAETQTNIQRLIPGNGNYPSAAELQEIARLKELEIQATRSRMTIADPRAGIVTPH